MYEYQAIVVRIVDGDTVILNVDLGFRIQREMDFRLIGIDAPELRGPRREDGEKSKKHMEYLLPTGSEVTIQTFKDKADKYGRYLTKISVIRNDGTAIDINRAMVAAGHAREIAS